MAKLKIASKRESMVSIGDRLRDARKQNGLTLRVAEDKSGVSRSSISNIENGQTCSLEVVSRLSKAYHVLPEMILFDEYPIVILKDIQNGAKEDSNLVKRIKACVANRLQSEIKSSKGGVASALD